ncbi:Gfo/Idh/MocA family oxidoreductase [Granulicella sp. dw_53]|uniref:Gfo/Idh/MocA family protein n=1 Tax=Granulicella sp. dw_53 TaxID=2719792 RepID=UPI001BD28F51|nr:Gfo/Idh/MocA family oxidoreductase [Granulicella sp. dw_53]
MVRWLLVGVGDIARKRVIPAILTEPRSQLYGVVTRDLKKADAYPGVAAWATLDAALQDDAIDAVYLASPVALHAPQAIACLKAGKHVLCEKPTAMNFSEAEEMVAAARESGRLLGVSYYRRAYPKLMRAKELIAEGAIGQPVLVEANAHGWLESEERGWLRDPALAGGGPLYDTGSHRIDAMNFLFGQPVRATGMLSNAVHPVGDGMGVEDSATVLIEYAGGVHGVVDVRWNSRVARDQFRVIGTEGEMNLDPLNGPALRVAGREELLPPHANLHAPVVGNFVEAVLDGAALVCPVEEAVWTDWVTEQVMKAGSRV